MKLFTAIVHFKITVLTILFSRMGHYPKMQKFPKVKKTLDYSGSVVYRRGLLNDQASDVLAAKAFSCTGHIRDTPKCCPHYRLSLYSIGFHSVPRIPVCQRNIGSFLLPPKLDVDSEEVTEQQSSCFPVIATIPHGYDTRIPLCLEAYDQICS